MAEIKIVIEQDMDTPDPRSEYDNFCTMVCFHRKYTLGDPDQKWESNLDWLSYVTNSHQDLNDQKDIDRLWSQFESDYFWLPLYLLDHSGLYIQNEKFTGNHAYWDSGQLGYIYVAKKKIAELIKSQITGKTINCITKMMEWKAHEMLKAETKVYNQYLSGDVWFYLITQNDETLDSCGAMYGYDHCEEQAKEAKRHHDGKRNQ